MDNNKKYTDDPAANFMQELNSILPEINSDLFKELSFSVNELPEKKIQTIKEKLSERWNNEKNNNPFLYLSGSEESLNYLKLAHLCLKYNNENYNEEDDFAALCLLMPTITQKLAMEMEDKNLPAQNYFYCKREDDKEDLVSYKAIFNFLLQEKEWYLPLQQIDAPDVAHKRFLTDKEKEYLRKFVDDIDDSVVTGDKTLHKEMCLKLINLLNGEKPKISRQTYFEFKMLMNMAASIHGHVQNDDTIAYSSVRKYAFSRFEKYYTQLRNQLLQEPDNTQILEDLWFIEKKGVAKIVNQVLYNSDCASEKIDNLKYISNNLMCDGDQYILPDIYDRNESLDVKYKMRHNLLCTNLFLSSFFLAFFQYSRNIALQVFSGALFFELVTLQHPVFGILSPDFMGDYFSENIELTIARYQKRSISHKFFKPLLVRNKNQKISLKHTLLRILYLGPLWSLPSNAVKLFIIFPLKLLQDIFISIVSRLYKYKVSRCDYLYDKYRWREEKAFDIFMKVLAVVFLPICFILVAVLSLAIVMIHLIIDPAQTILFAKGISEEDGNKKAQDCDNEKWSLYCSYLERQKKVFKVLPYVCYALVIVLFCLPFWILNGPLLSLEIVHNFFSHCAHFLHLPLSASLFANTLLVALLMIQLFRLVHELKIFDLSKDQSKDQSELRYISYQSQQSSCDLNNMCDTTEKPSLVRNDLQEKNSDFSIHKLSFIE